MTDSDKLKLILEHAAEYYENSRKYKFVTNGFMAYELFDLPIGRALYIADIFVSRDSRGGQAFKDLIKFSLDLEHTENVVVAYARTELTNPYLRNMQDMYERIGFVVYEVDEEAMYFRLDV